MVIFHSYVSLPEANFGDGILALSRGKIPQRMISSSQKKKILQRWHPLEKLLPGCHDNPSIEGTMEKKKQPRVLAPSEDRPPARNAPNFTCSNMF